MKKEKINDNQYRIKINYIYEWDLWDFWHEYYFDLMYIILMDSKYLLLINELWQWIIRYHHDGIQNLLVKRSNLKPSLQRTHWFKLNLRQLLWIFWTESPLFTITWHWPLEYFWPTGQQKPRFGTVPGISQVIHWPLLGLKLVIHPGLAFVHTLGEDK